MKKIANGAAGFSERVLNKINLLILKQGLSTITFLECTTWPARFKKISTQFPKVHWVFPTNKASPRI